MAIVVERISVVLIARNERENIGKMLIGLLERYGGKILEIIVADDSSTDGTAAEVEARMAKDPRIRLLRLQPPAGAGRALKAGFAAVSADAEYVLSMDSDFTESIGDVGTMIRRAEAGDVDGVIGSRFIKGSTLRRYPAPKKAMNRAFHALTRLFFGIRLNDLTNNFKLYRRCIVTQIAWRSDGFAINAETGLAPVLSGFRIDEVPVSWIGRSRRMGSSKFRLASQAWGYLAVLAYARSLAPRSFLSLALTPPKG
jgi:dolichol-phosphate mannosyltransferase